MIQPDGDKIEGMNVYRITCEIREAPIYILSYETLTLKQIKAMAKAGWQIPGVECYVARWCGGPNPYRQGGGNVWESVE